MRIPTRWISNLTFSRSAAVPGIAAQALTASGRRHGNPPSYEAVRSARWVYVEYEDGAKEYHDLTADPYELRNSFSALGETQKSALHALVSAIQNCHDAEGCRAAERAVHLAQ